MADDPRAILDACTPEMRAALNRLRSGPKFLGQQPPAIPRGSAAGLRRRGLVDDYAGSQVRLTEVGQAVADLGWRRRLRYMPPGDGLVRLSAIVPARRDERYAPGCLDGQLSETVTIKKDMGGSYTGVLVDYEILLDGGAIKVTLDVPAAVTTPEMTAPVAP